MNKQTRKVLDRAGYTLLASCAAALLLNVVAFISTNNISKNLEVRSNFSKENADATWTQDVSYQAAYFEAILNIIKSYYVDEERLFSQDSLVSILDILKLHPQIKTRKRTDATYELKIGAETRSLTLSPHPELGQFIDHLIELSQFIDRNLVESNEPNDHKIANTRGEFLVIDALLQSLDAHSSLLNSAAYNDLRQGTEGAFGGVGLVVGMKDGILTVLKPIAGSPAKKAGVQRFDKIVTINNQETFGLTLDQLVESMRGQPGSYVDIQTLRAGYQAPKSYRLRREMINVDSVTSRTINDQDKTYLLTKIENFSAKTGLELKTAIIKHQRRHGGKVDGLIIDLRSNPGGLLDQAIEVANLFIKEGVIVSTKGRRNEVEMAYPGTKFYGFPIVVLQNEDSASASEIVAGALQDQQRAVIIGQPSFGKGSVQTIFELPDEQALKLTIARYYTPSGRSIQNTGIEPNVWLHPIVEKSTNKNLLGSYRYHGEIFLRNRLENTTVRNQQMFSAKDVMQRLQGFYTVSKEYDEFNEQQINEPELEAAKIILKHAASTKPYSDNSQQWLVSAYPALTAYVSDINQKSQHWLHENHKVIWEENRHPVDQRNLDLSIVGKRPFHVAPGKTLEIPWIIKNNGSKAVNRLSVFSTPFRGNLEPTEILVGRLLPGESKSGILTIQAGKDLTTEQNSFLSIGFAVNAKPSNIPPSRIEVVTIQEERSTLSAYAFLKENEKSKIPGILEANESANLHVVIKNISGVTAKNLKVQIDNFAGKQLNLNVPESNLNELSPGEKTEMVIPVTANNAVGCDRFRLGLTIQSGDLNDQMRQILTIPGEQGHKKPVTKPLVSH